MEQQKFQSPIPIIQSAREQQPLQNRYSTDANNPNIVNYQINEYKSHSEKNFRTQQKEETDDILQKPQS